jgi:23S rRNA pseudouridine2605 synthase
MITAVDSKVIELERIAIGDIRLGHLKEGHYRKLTPSEIEYLKNC